MLVPSSARIGVFAVALGLLVFVPAYWWANTRTLTAVDMPVSLAPGHIRTGEFAINTETYFSIQIWAPYDAACQYGTDGLRTKRITSIGSQSVQPPGSGGEVIAGPYLGAFTGKPGKYKLDIEVLSATQDLDACHPQLVIEASAYDFTERDSLLSFLFPFFVFCELLGLTLLCAWAAEHFRTRAFEKIRLNIADARGDGFAGAATEEKTERGVWLRTRQRSSPSALWLFEQTPAWGITGLRHKRFPVRRIWPVGLPGNVSTVALVCALSWFVCFIPIWFVAAAGHRATYGLVVSVPRQGVASKAIAPGLTAPLISVDAKRRVFLNYEETTWEKLPASLDEALRLLPVRVAYFDGDTDALYMDAAHAVDVIVGAGAKPILLTPRSKREIK